MQTTETSLLRTRQFRLLANSLGVCVLVPPLYFVTFYLLWMEWGIKNSFVVLLKVSEWHRTNDKVRLESFDNGSLNATLHRDFVRHTRVPCDQRPINFLYLMVQYMTKCSETNMEEKQRCNILTQLETSFGQTLS